MKEYLKKTAKKLLPEVLFDFLVQKRSKFRNKRSLKAIYRYDYKRYKTYSDALLGSDTAQKLIGKIIREYHVVEKGLTMPESRLGFGYDLLKTLSKDCVEYIDKYGSDEPQLLHALGVITEYETFHKERNFQLDKDVQLAIDSVKYKKINAPVCQQRTATKVAFFKDTESSFPVFAHSRASVRNYTAGPIPMERIIKALEIAQTTPSQCNRQCWRTYVYTNKAKMNEILLTQGGNRGFGHLSDKLIVITSELGVFNNNGERNGAFIDGGMYAMNLLYALHYEKIAACILNCSNRIEKDLELRKLCGIKESEVFIAMISCGIPPEEFKIAASKRYDVKCTNTIKEDR